MSTIKRQNYKVVNVRFRTLFSATSIRHKCQNCNALKLWNSALSFICHKRQDRRVENAVYFDYPPLTYPP